MISLSLTVILQPSQALARTSCGLDGGLSGADLAAWKAEVELNNFARKKVQDGWACSLREEALEQPYDFGHLARKGRRESFAQDG